MHAIDGRRRGAIGPRFCRGDTLLLSLLRRLWLLLLLHANSHRSLLLRRRSLSLLLSRNGLLLGQKLVSLELLNLLLLHHLLSDCRMIE